MTAASRGYAAPNPHRIAVPVAPVGGAGAPVAKVPVQVGSTPGGRTVAHIPVTVPARASAGIVHESVGGAYARPKESPVINVVQVSAGPLASSSPYAAPAPSHISRSVQVLSTPVVYAEPAPAPFYVAPAPGPVVVAVPSAVVQPSLPIAQPAGQVVVVNTPDGNRVRVSPRENCCENGTSTIVLGSLTVIAGIFIASIGTLLAVLLGALIIVSGFVAIGYGCRSASNLRRAPDPDPLEEPVGGRSALRGNVPPQIGGEPLSAAAPGLPAPSAQGQGQSSVSVSSSAQSDSLDTRAAPSGSASAPAFAPPPATNPSAST